MSQQSPRPGTVERPLRVAIVGSGPAGFYCADFVLKAKREDQALTTEVDLFDRLPTPFGLVRSGVAPDHQGIKKVTKAFEKIADNERFRFFGNVEFGRDLHHGDLLEHYDQIVYAVGSATDRKLGVEGEELEGSHAATEFVGWYNAHPDYRGLRFDLSARRAVVVGMGNVAMDVTRILVRDPKELAETDIAGYALEALTASRVEEVVLLGRRGPKEAAFTPRELKDIAELPNVEVVIDGGMEAVPSPEGLGGVERQNVEFMAELAKAAPSGKPKRVRLRFLSSPVAVLGDAGKMVGLDVEANALVEGPDGNIRAKGTGHVDRIEAGLLFRSIGYKGTALPGVPFDERSGTIPNDLGRVLDAPGGTVLTGVYAVGWIKRGPSGLIGTNKSDAKETVDCLLDDVSQLPLKSLPPTSTICELLSSRGVRVVDFPAWRKLDALETSRGVAGGKVRDKFTSVDAMLAALD
jgi:ferredoxin/flavodoxin---NADP+ reductase